MLRVVIDTNALVSAILSRKDTSVRNALTHAYKHHQVYLSPETLAELREVLMRPKFDKYLSREEREAALLEVELMSEIIPAAPVVGVSIDPKDDKFFALAKAAGAHYLISGDKKDVLSVPVYEGTHTVHPTDFVWASEKVLALSKLWETPRTEDHDASVPSFLKSAIS